MSQLQPSIEETESTGQLFAVSPVVATAATATTTEADDKSHDAPAGSSGDDDVTGEYYNIMCTMEPLS